MVLADVGLLGAVRGIRGHNCFECFFDDGTVLKQTGQGVLRSVTGLISIIMMQLNLAVVQVLDSLKTLKLSE
eukprot:6484125-Amphidinium_carterae.1